MGVSNLDSLEGGLHLGSLVQAGGRVGQLVKRRAEDGKLQVNFLGADSEHFEPGSVRSALIEGTPGHGGGDQSFDLAVGPLTRWDAIQDEVAISLFEKGFCVLRFTGACDTKSAIKTLTESGKLHRLPEAVEEGYLGRGCQGSVAWMEPDAEDLIYQPDLNKSEGFGHMLGECLKASVDDVGGFVSDRSVTLACLAIEGEDEYEWPHQEADNASLGLFLQTHRRSAVKAVHFMGPGSADISLDSKDNEDSKKLPLSLDSVTIDALPNTVVIFRPTCFQYYCDPPRGSLMTIHHFLIPQPEINMNEFGDSIAQQPNVMQDILPQNALKPPQGDCVNVLHVSTRLSGEANSDEFYRNSLISGTDGVVKVPLTRWDVDEYYIDSNDFLPFGKMNNKHQGYIEGAELFDNKYFEISLSEAGGMDPVQRLILEVGAVSMRQQGYSKTYCNRNPMHGGVAVGNDKLDWMFMDKGEGVMVAGTSTVLAILANRFNFVFNLKGPSYVCDTACSASLASTHLAKFALLDRRADPLDFFISLGAHLSLMPGPFIGCCHGNMSTVKGRCFTFNASADGYLRGEGVSGLFLKCGTFEDKDAILRGTNMGQDGRSASLTAPNGPAQEGMITRALRDGKMSSSECTAWECHGTGTALGDPIEIGSVRKVLVKEPRDVPLMIGSVKSNYGHLEGGAAMGGLCKAVLGVKHGFCEPTLHVRQLNPHLEYEAFDAVFQTERSMYRYSSGNYSVSSFGFGGTNGHGIFWGSRNEARSAGLDRKSFALRQLRAAPVPDVRPYGRDPDDWECDLPDPRLMSTESRVSVKLPKGRPGESYVVNLLDQEEVDEGGTFYITGNFNDWTEDEMLAGTAVNVYTFTAEVPTSGVLEFRFLKDNDQDQVIAPASDDCTQKTEVIEGPKAGLTNKWSVAARPNSEVQIELLFSPKARSVLWLKKKA